MSDKEYVTISRQSLIDAIKVLKHYSGLLAETYDSMFDMLDTTFEELLDAFASDSEYVKVPDELNQGIECLELCTRTYNALIRYGICTIADVLNYPPDRFIRIRNFGKSSARELTQRMHEKGYNDFRIIEL